MSIADVDEEDREDGPNTAHLQQVWSSIRSQSASVGRFHRGWDVFFEACVCLCLHTDTCVCVYTQTHVSVCTHRRMCLCAHTDIRVCVCTRTHVSVCTHRHMCLCAHTDTCVCVHTQTHSPWLQVVAELGDWGNRGSVGTLTRSAIKSRWIIESSGIH